MISEEKKGIKYLPSLSRFPYTQSFQVHRLDEVFEKNCKSVKITFKVALISFRFLYGTKSISVTF